MTQFLENIWKSIATFCVGSGIKIVCTLVLLFVGFSVIKHFVRFISKRRGFQKLDKGIQSFLKSFIGIGLKIILIVSAATVLGIPMTSVIAVLGSAGLAIGLAFQGSLSNIAGGFIILVFKPFTVGDVITAGDNAGTVTDIGIFYTKITTADNRKIVIPNSIISNQSIVNAVANSTRRVDLDITVSYDADLTTVKKLLLKIANQHEKILKDPAPFARVTKHGDSAIVFSYRVWCNSEDYWDVLFDLNETVKTEFDQNSISIPYPQLDVHISNPN